MTRTLSLVVDIRFEFDVSFKSKQTGKTFSWDNQCGNSTWNKRTVSLLRKHKHVLEQVSDVFAQLSLDGKFLHYDAVEVIPSAPWTGVWRVFLSNPRFKHNMMSMSTESPKWKWKLKTASPSLWKTFRNLRGTKTIIRKSGTLGKRLAAQNSDFPSADTLGEANLSIWESGLADWVSAFGPPTSVEDVSLWFHVLRYSIE